MWYATGHGKPRLPTSWYGSQEVERMTAIEIIEMEPAHYGVRITEGSVTTGVRVLVPEGFVDDLLLDDVDPERIVHESVGFLLERIPATSVPRELSLDQIGRDYPEFSEELEARLRAA
jgi:hypothetical protein